MITLLIGAGVNLSVRDGTPPRRLGRPTPSGVRDNSHRLNDVFDRTR
ncbi:hypothetical protein [Mycolicibacterium tokaiense]|nr:hypothetical protein [Mycolicibacterium tokaiense]